MPEDRRAVDPNAEEEKKKKKPTYGTGASTLGFGRTTSSGPGDTGVDPYFQEVDQSRDEAIESARRIAAEVRSGIKTVEESGKTGRGLMRRQAAQGLAAGIGANAGKAKGPGGISVLQQGALDQGASQAEFEAGHAARLTAARIKAEEADLGAKTFEKEATPDFTVEEAKMGTRFVEVVSPYKDQGIGGVLGNDEEGAADALERDLLPTIKNPVLRKRLKAQIALVRSGKMKF